jgi:hypothetical protein
VRALLADEADQGDFLNETTYGAPAQSAGQVNERLAQGTKWQITRSFGLPGSS